VLQELHLEKNLSFGPKALDEIAQHCRQLKSFSLSQHPRIARFDRFTKYCTQLVHLAV